MKDKKKCGNCANLTEFDGRLCCRYDLEEYMSDDGWDILTYLCEDEDASDCKNYTPTDVR